MKLIDYLKQHFLTREQLLARTGIDEDRLQEWQALGMMPRPSYRLRLDLACGSFFGQHEESHRIDWYAQGYVAWAGLLAALDGPREAYAVFAQRYRRRLANLAVDKRVTYPQALAADTHIEAEWRHFLDGTYGLCTRSGLPEDIAAKEAAIVLIRALTASGAPQGLKEEERDRLAAAVELLDRASSPFAPHEVKRSSRRRYVDEIRAAWLR
ncbi:hypothetical protein SRABI118_02236 [Massilia sp. Bi118]|uniref:DUF6058 family natural product biosynthesis protein n=1 Tax=Massilia sp. Bi118 TaxID=2822346 RepID=UPI001DB2AFD0|nr:DUF6058 family natural product biosynthesis protein [Massilia sp. Bi118]CAH0221438.1 hypothetical protein SRABI118_02236 [Massilia sp. Bi118]